MSALPQPWVGTNCGFSAFKLRPAVLKPSYTTGKGFFAEQSLGSELVQEQGILLCCSQPLWQDLNPLQNMVLAPDFAIIANQDAFWMLGTHGNHQDKLVPMKEEWSRARILGAPPEGAEPALQHSTGKPFGTQSWRYSQMPWRTHLGLFCHQTPKK